jgi:ribosomal protein L28
MRNVQQSEKNQYVRSICSSESDNKRNFKPNGHVKSKLMK